MARTGIYGNGDTAGGPNAGARLYDLSEVDHNRLRRQCAAHAGDVLLTYDDSPTVWTMAHQDGFQAQPIAMRTTHNTVKTELLIARNLTWTSKPPAPDPWPRGGDSLGIGEALSQPRAGTPGPMGLGRSWPGDLPKDTTTTGRPSQRRHGRARQGIAIAARRPPGPQERSRRRPGASRCLPGRTWTPAHPPPTDADARASPAPAHRTTALKRSPGTVTGMSTHQRVPLTDLRDDPTLRLRPDDPTMVAILAEVLEACPPILVDPIRMRIIDGHARYAAARALGWHDIPVTWTAADADQAALIRQAITANTAHGKPLTAEQRRQAVAVLLRVDPSVSDREAARICGVRALTVREIRHTMAAEGGKTAPLRRRGRDGKLYPLDRHHTRAALTAAAAANQGISARALARTGPAHASPTTAARVLAAARETPPPAPAVKPGCSDLPSESRDDGVNVAVPGGTTDGQLTPAHDRQSGWLARLLTAVLRLVTGWLHPRIRREPTGARRDDGHADTTPQLHR